LATVGLQLLAEYDPDDVYNLDEAALYFRLLPEHSLVFKNAPMSGAKTAKARVTIMLACNMTGTDKLRPLIVGSSKAPRCFKGVKTLPTSYTHSAKAWMTSRIFESFMHDWDKRLAAGRRRIALILDNCPAHPVIELQNIRLVFLPPHTTALIQPLDQGIIRCFKALYRSDLSRRIIRYIDAGNGRASELTRSITLLDALHMVMAAWSRVSQMCIANCFRKAGMVLQESDTITENSMPAELPANMDEREFNEWVAIDDDIPTAVLLTDEQIAQEVVGKDEEAGENENFEATTDSMGDSLNWCESFEAVELLKMALGMNGATDAEFALIYKLEHVLERLRANGARQTTLDEYSK